MKRLHISAIGILIACIAAFAVLAFVEGPDVITEQVEGLTMEQDGTEILVTWKRMDCRSYTLSFTCEGKLTVIPNLEKNEYVIRNVVPDQRYSVSVSANLKSGKVSKSAKTELIAAKLRQKLTVGSELCDGFRGDTCNLEAKADGPVTYVSKNVKVAKVDENGTVKMMRPGRSEIAVEVAANGIYERSVKNVQVNVYPESLGTAALKLEEGDTEISFQWDKVAFAQGYRLLKYNPAKETYEKLADLSGGETSYKMARDAGKYKIRAYAEVKDKTVVGEASEAAEVTSISADAPAYSSLHTVSTISSSDVDAVTYLTGNQSSRNLQSMSFTGKHYVICFSNRSSTAGSIEAYDRKGRMTGAINTGSIGHANGSTYNPNTGKIYVMKTYAGHRIRSIATFDGKTLERTGDISTDRAPSGIAYDVSNDKYYMSAGPRLYVTDGNMVMQKTISRKRCHTSQDMSAYNGVAMSCIWSGGMNSAIDLYRESDSAYIGSIGVTLGEIESVVVVDGRFAILVNVPGSSRDALYITKERVKMPGGSEDTAGSE